MSRTRMFLILAMLFIVSLFLIGFGNWLYVFTYYTYLYTFEGPVKITVQPYWTLGLGLVVCGILVLAVAFILLSDWYHLLIHKPVEEKLEVQKMPLSFIEELVSEYYKHILDDKGKPKYVS